MTEAIPEQSNPDIPNKNGQPATSNEKRRRNILIGLVLLLLLFCIGIYFFFTSKAFRSGAIQDNGETPTPIKQNYSTANHTYVNEKYNFTFQYPDDVYYEKKPINQYQLADYGRTVIITEVIYNSDGTTTILPVEYKLYDASTSDKEHLSDWWKRTHKTDFGNFKVPDGYDTIRNTAPFIGCIKSFDQSWQLPPALEVLPKGALETEAQEAAELPGVTEEPIDPTRVIYLYYDFGKPFVLRFEEPFGGGCGGQHTYKVLTTIKKLHE